MNPKITITVDTKNKAISSLAGMVTVGAKIDVVVNGISAADVPDWGDDDKFTGKSLRFRVVDEAGHDLVRFPLNEKSDTVTGDVWTVSGDIFTAADVEFDTDVLRKAFDGVPFSDNMELGVILDSIVDDAQYAVGRIKIRQWTSASTEDPTALPDWRETLAELKENLASVEASKTAAEASATSAGESATAAATSANTASLSASNAAASQTAAETAKTAAENAQAAAVTAETAAEAAQTGAEVAEGKAETAVTKYPYIDTNNHWQVWDAETTTWVDKGIAKGDKGDKGDKGEQGVQGEKGEKGDKGDTGTVILDDSVTKVSENGVKSSGIWSWVKSLLPEWLTSSYAEPAKVSDIPTEDEIKAIKVDSATYADSADTANSASLADVAKTAYKADKATTADTATADANGNNIVNTYQTMAGAALTYAPLKHASNHATGGTDPISPADIGALAVDGTAVLASRVKNDSDTERADGSGNVYTGTVQNVGGYYTMVYNKGQASAKLAYNGYNSTKNTYNYKASGTYTWSLTYYASTGQVCWDDYGSVFSGYDKDLSPLSGDALPDITLGTSGWVATFTAQSTGYSSEPSAVFARSNAAIDQVLTLGAAGDGVWQLSDEALTDTNNETIGY